MQTNVHSNIHMSQKVETTEMSVNEWMDKQNVVIYNIKYYTAIKYWHTLQHKRTLKTCYVKKARHKRPYAAWCHRYEMSKRGRGEHRDTKQTGVCQQLGAQRREEGLLTSLGLHFSLMTMFLNLIVVMVANSVNTLKPMICIL